MGILDDAIKEHLELKRSHGADASELKQLEDEAFGAAERPGDEAAPPDPAAEAPTEFMQQPDLEPDAGVAAAPEVEAPANDEPSGRPSPRSEIADLQEGPQAPEAEQDAPEFERSPPEPEQPAEEESPAMEHEAIPEQDPPIEPSGPSTEEREAIAEQPTEMYDLEEELAAAAPEAEAEEELIAEEDEEDDDFWDEKRLSDELDQALEAPSEAEEELAPPPPAEPAPEPAPAPEPPAPEPDDSAPADGPDEDVLEETPDFLEEAPEADRLWFEQKPPKDFDFDD